MLQQQQQLTTWRLETGIKKNSSRSSSRSSSSSSNAAAATHDSAEPGNSPGSSQLGEVVVLCSPADTNRFMAADLSKNQPGSYYHLRKPETTQLAMSFPDWLAAWQSWQQSRLLLQVDVCQWELQDKGAAAAGSSGKAAGHKARLWPNPAVWPHLPQLLHASRAAGPAAASLINWPLLQQLLQDGQYQAQGGLQLLAGGRDALLPAKYETHDRLLCQVSGRQQLLLVPPEQGFQGCYAFPVAHPYDRYSCVDWEEPELLHWPARQLVQPACVSLAVSLQPLPAKLQRPGALLMQLSRMIELWALAESQEWQLLEKQLATPKGFKLLRGAPDANTLA
ncbi:hypothetical protein COO60DRAFT_1661632 [Scenedesmus sp. NREL 46B-D3]|nr:hypothetical protein COO60DRAFT_1661632 [Scenedesmus sp. NREL 46B-D3]